MTINLVAVVATVACALLLILTTRGRLTWLGIFTVVALLSLGAWNLGILVGA